MFRSKYFIDATHDYKCRFTLPVPNGQVLFAAHEHRGRIRGSPDTAMREGQALAVEDVCKTTDLKKG